jgi:hypothetical protein
MILDIVLDVVDPVEEWLGSTVPELPFDGGKERDKWPPRQTETLHEGTL